MVNNENLSDDRWIDFVSKLTLLTIHSNKSKKHVKLSDIRASINAFLKGNLDNSTWQHVIQILYKYYLRKV